MRIVRILFKTMGVLLTLVILAILAINVYPHTRPAPKTVRKIGTIHIAAPFKVGLSFIDYLALRGSTIYAGYTTHGIVGVIDAESGRTIATVAGLGGVHGIALVPESNLGFASSSGDNVVAVFDLSTNKLLKSIPVSEGPDAIIYDARVRLVYVAAKNTGILIDPTTQTMVANIPLGGQPEYPQADPQSGLIYQNLEDTSELVVIDPQQRSVVRRYPLAPGIRPTGIALDAANRRLFSTCSRKLIVMNADTGAIVAVLRIGSFTDGVGYDARLHRVYTANGIGSMTVIRQDSADRYQVLEDAPTVFGGHSLAVDPATNRIFVAAFGSITVYEPDLR